MAVEGSEDSVNAPPNGIVVWDNQTVELDDVEIVLNQQCTPRNMNSKLPEGILGLATSSASVEDYIDEHGQGEIELPRYYSRFEEEFGNDNAECDYSRPVTTDSGEADGESKSGLDGTPVEAALRALDGGGQYSKDDYRLHDCLPMPCVLRGVQGAILIAPYVPNRAY